MGTTIQELLSAFGLVEGAPGASSDEILELLEEWRSFFDEQDSVDTSDGQLALWATTIETLLDTPDDRDTKLDLLAQASENPLVGVTLVLAALPGTAVRQGQRWWDMMFTEQTSDGFTNDWNILTLPAPGTADEPVDGATQKYLIISDLHRDAASDDLGPFEPGSIDHFKANQDLYGRVLDFVLASSDYTLLEGGDCEELWFVRDLAAFPKDGNGRLDMGAKMQEIVDSHVDVYEKLRQLHEQGRYFRIYGNHDSFLEDATVRAVLEARMDPGDTRPFTIYDAFVIPGVKTMQEHAASAILGDVADLVTGGQTATQFIDRLFKGRLGMDANDYTDTTSMLITHGHQFDFWNSSENEILGLLISNTVGMFVDRNMDPFLDLRGVALQGNPFIDFADVFSGWPVFNSWLGAGPSLQFAHQVQHTANSDRVLKDDIMYWESLAALYGGLGIALNHTDPISGMVVTPADSRSELSMATPAGLAEYLGRHHFHHICIGHTHNPHSQPFFTLENLEQLASPLTSVVTELRSLIPDLLEPALKTTYFNSGTAGWMEGVIWAIEIDEDGQAKLVYWAENSRGFEYMDWELTKMEDSLRQQLDQRVDEVIGGAVTAVETSVEDLYTRLRLLLQELNVAASDIADALGQAAIMPIHVLSAAIMAKAPVITPPRELNEVGGAVRDQIDELEGQLERLRSFIFDISLSVKRRSFGGFSSDSDTDSFILRAPLPDAAKDRLMQFKQIFKRLGRSDDEALHFGGLGMSVFNDFPRRVPFFSSIDAVINPISALQSSSYPVLQSMLSTLWMYPPKGRTVDTNGVRIASELKIVGSQLELNVTLSDPNAAPPIV